jgi:23S rRNA pseudouridine2605 synthase
MSKLERLQKVLAHAGVASRRSSEQLIQDGRIAVNGQIVTQLGTKVDPLKDVVSVDGELLAKTEKMVYVMLNKPTEVLSTAHDERNRITVLDLVEEIKQRVYPVGRLDQQSEGLILLMNDGDLAEKLTHPRYHLEKEYQVLVRGKPSWEFVKRWREGDVKLPDEPPPAPAWVERIKIESDATWYKIILTEGRKRQIRNVAQILGHPVRKLIRVRIGPIELGRLKSGHWRHLSNEEVNLLKRTVTGKKQKGRKTIR